MTVAYGDVPLIDPLTGRFPDAFTPPSVAAAVTAAQTAQGLAEDARDAAQAANATTVATGEVVGDDLILTRTDATTVNAGNVRGATNSLAIGTVTTGAPGSAAAASVTGTAPSQVLNLTIPTGATGAVSAWEYYAAGRPDVVGTLDAAALAWRNAAPSGSTFYSTNGPQGAWVWRKRGTSWECVEGDTGWVTSNSLDTAIRAAWPEAAGLERVGHLRRRPGTVDCYLGGGGGGVLSTRRDFSGGPGTVPSWARPDKNFAIAATPEVPTIVRITTRADGRFEIVGNWVGYTNTVISWPVASNLEWPTTLA